MDYKCDLCFEVEFVERLRLTESLGIKNEKYKVVSCLNCSLHSIHPIPNDIEFKKIYENYAVQGNRIDVEKYRIKNVYPRRFKQINDFCKNAKTILDIGAGNGGFVSTALSNGYNVTGIELESDQVTLAKETFDVELLNITFEEYIKKNDSKFDVIHLHHVFEHVQKPSKILIDIKKILTPNGIVIMEVPNQFFKFPNQLYFFLRLIKYRKPYNPYHHLYFYSKKTLLKYFIQSGYDVLFIKDKNDKNQNIKSKIKNAIATTLKLSTSSVIEIIVKQKIN